MLKMATSGEASKSRSIPVKHVEMTEEEQRTQRHEVQRTKRIHTFLHWEKLAGLAGSSSSVHATGGVDSMLSSSLTCLDCTGSVLTVSACEDEVDGVLMAGLLSKGVTWRGIAQYQEGMLLTKRGKGKAR